MHFLIEMFQLLFLCDYSSKLKFTYLSGCIDRGSKHAYEILWAVTHNKPSNCSTVSSHSPFCLGYFIHNSKVLFFCNIQKLPDVYFCTKMHHNVYHAERVNNYVTWHPEAAPCIYNTSKVHCPF